MYNVWITPKLDWTRTDYYNFEDLNRVEVNTEVVAGFVGYFTGLPPLSFLTDRSMKRIEFADSLNRIESNQDVLRQRFTPSGWLHRIAGSEAQRMPKKVEGKAEDVRLDAVDLWENRNLLVNPEGTYKGWELTKLRNGSPVPAVGSDYEITYPGGGGNGFGPISPMISVRTGDTFALWNKMHSGNTRYPNSFIRQVFAYDAKRAMLEDAVLSPLVNTFGGIYSAFINTYYPTLMQYGDNVSPEGYMTFQVIDDRVAYIRVKLGSYRDSAVNEFTSLLGYKLEYGDKVTPWQPAPEDGIPWYHPTKTINLAPINLSSLDQYESSAIEWEADTPDGTGVAVEYSFDEESWTAIQSGQSLPFRKGDWLTGKVLYLRQRLFTNDQSITPAIRNFRYEINGYQTKVKWKANDPFDFNDALRLEHNLNLLYKHYKGNAEIVPICGAFICGEEVI